MFQEVLPLMEDLCEANLAPEVLETVKKVNSALQHRFTVLKIATRAGWPSGKNNHSNKVSIWYQTGTHITTVYMSFSARLYLRMRGTTEADPAVLESLVMAHKEETSKRETDADDISSGARAGGQGRRSRGRGRGWTNHRGRGGGGWPCI